MTPPTKRRVRAFVVADQRRRVELLVFGLPGVELSFHDRFP